MFKNITKSIAVLSVLSLGGASLAFAGSGEEQPPSTPSVAPQIAGGFGATNMWAFVRADGTHVATGGLGVVSSQLFGAGNGRYEVIFRRAIGNNCLYSVNIAGQNAGVYDAAIATVQQRSGNNKGLFVRTFDAAGAPIDHDFSVGVSCYR